MMEKTPLYAFFGHHKCASTFITDVINSVCWELGLKPESVGSPETFNFNLENFVNDSKLDFLIYYSSNDNYVKRLKNLVGFHVIRDPRDILISAYYSHLKTHSTRNWPNLAVHRKELQGLSKQEGLMCEMECRVDQFNRMAEWNYQRPYILELKFEELVKAPVDSFKSIFRFLGLLEEGPDSFHRAFLQFLMRTSLAVRGRSGDRLRLLPYPKSLSIERLARIVCNHDFRKKSGGRKPGEEDLSSHYRKGVPGDWRSHFTPTVKSEFKRRYNDLLIGLNYEKNSDW
jgi:hypothetical protein